MSKTAVVHMRTLGRTMLWTACGRRWARFTPGYVLIERLEVVDDWSLVTCGNCLKVKPK